ncbi:MAG TPA: hypothetical protein VLS89_12885, partial [Candidatus Nanopelagicales bacterium]|nr:hypothetical protein [Candidatus Nanopelagicales bacterium]
MTAPPDLPQSLLARALLALAALALAALFGVLLVLILLAPIDDAPLLTGWFLRGFVFFMFGSIAAGAFAYAYRLILPARDPPLPSALLSRCPACGEPWSAARLCPQCAQPRAACAGAWRPAAPSADTHFLFLDGIGCAIVFLGLFLASMSTEGG